MIDHQSGNAVVLSFITFLSILLIVMGIASVFNLSFRGEIEVNPPEGQAAGNTYYVAVTGSDTYSCAQAANSATPRRTIANGLKCLGSTDTLSIGPGLYTEAIGPDTIPSGRKDSTGKIYPTLIKGVKGQTILRPATNPQYGNVIYVANRSYITFDGLILDGTNVQHLLYAVGGTSSYIRLENSVVAHKNNPVSACVGIVDYNSVKSNLQFVNNEIYDCKNSLTPDKDLYNHGIAHGIYLRATDSLVWGNRIHDVTGYGIRTDVASYPNNNSIYANNRVWNTSTGGGIQVGGGTNSQVFNNITWNTNLGYLPWYKPGEGSGIYVGISEPNNGARHSRVYNNTVVANTGWCIMAYYGSGDIIKNNICWQNGKNNTILNANNSVVENNLFVDPKFVNAAAGDFHLRPDSPAIDKGLTFSEITKDFDGNPRPQGSAYDIGAYEFGGTTTPPVSATVTTDKSFYAPGETIRVSVSGNNADPAEWVALYLAASPDSAYSFQNNWQYLNGQNFQRPSQAIAKPVALSFKAPATPGSYNFRYFGQAEYGNRLAISQDIEVGTNFGVSLSSLPFSGTPLNGWGPVEKDRSNGELGAADGRTITLNGVPYAKGLGVHAPSEVKYALNGKYTAFMADIGVDDEMTSTGSVIFQVWADNVKLYQSPLMYTNSPTQKVNVSVAGKQELKLVVTDGGNGNGADHADWANATLVPLSFDFALQGSSAKSVIRGNPVDAAITTSLEEGASQPVSFTASGLPAGALASFTPAACPPPCTSIMTIRTAVTTPAGTYTISVTGTAGTTVRQATVPLTVIAPLPSVTFDKSSYAPGEAITVTVNGGNGNPTEWVALYVASNPDSAYSFQNNWKYLNGSQNPPAKLPSYPVTLTFSAPSAPGTYNFRYFGQAEIANRLKVSSNFTVAPPLVVTFGKEVTLKWSISNATSCTASGGWSGSKPMTGSQVVDPEVTTTYTLTCTGPGGTVSQSVTVPKP